jgi:hypothetical protein
MNDFLDAYKHLEKICSEIFNQQHGITQYIDEMCNTPRFASLNIQGWNRDLENLKRVRHIRNAMVHDPSYNTDDYQTKDVEFLKDFYNRILQQQDPLSLLRIQARAASHKPAPVTINPQTYIPGSSSINSTKPSSFNHVNPDNDEWDTSKFIFFFIVVMTFIGIFGWIAFYIFF